MKFIITLLLFIPSLSWGAVSFKKGERVDSYKGIGWPTIEKHDLDAGKEWSQSIDTEFSRLGKSSHKFEFRALDCKGYDCSRGDFKGSFGRTETYISTKEQGENWYAWSFYIDDSELTYSSESDDEGINNHSVQFGQMKLNKENEVFPHCRKYGGENVFIFQYKKKFKGLAFSRQHCTKKTVVETHETATVIPENILFNQWHDVIIHAHWGNEGFLKLYINGDLKYFEEGFITNQYSYKGKSYGPSFRYGIYQNNAPKSFNGKVTAWYDGIGRAKKCTDKNFSELLIHLGYSCNSLSDKDNQVIKPNFIEYLEYDDDNNDDPNDENNETNFNNDDSIDKSKYTSIASDENFEDGDYELMWFWKIFDEEGKLEQDLYLGSDQANIKNGILTFTKLDKSFEMEDKIQSKNRKKINFKTEDGLILISANLDLASDGETASMVIVGSASKDTLGSYYAEGPWDDEGKEIIGIKFKPISK